MQDRRRACLTRRTTISTSASSAAYHGQLKRRDTMKNLILAACLGTIAVPAYAQHMIVGIDNKVYWDAEGKPVLSPPGKDAVAIYDIGDRMNPRLVASLPLMNSVYGPPTNLAITPADSLALVANSMDWVQDGGAWKASPGNDIFVIDLKANPPALIATIKAGKQPSGMAINLARNLTLVANRTDKSITVLSILGRDVKLVDTVAIAEQPSTVACTPD